MFGLSFASVVLLCLFLGTLAFHLYRTHGYKGVITYTEGLLSTARNIATDLRDANDVLRDTNRTLNQEINRADETIYNLRSEVRELANAPRVRYKNAEEALADILSSGPCIGAECLAKMETRGYSESSTYMAKSALEVTSQKIGDDWVWFPKGTTEEDWTSQLTDNASDFYSGLTATA